MMKEEDYTKAFDYANYAHQGQVRKFLGTPYISHPIAVEKMVRKYLEEVKASPGLITIGSQAALLHDTVEDCDVTLEDIEKEFGDDVRETVYYLTDQASSEDGNRRVRKAKNTAHIKNGTWLSKTIKACDCMHNIRDMVISDPGFARVYALEKEDLLFSALGDAHTQAKKDLNEVIQNVLFLYHLPKPTQEIVRLVKYKHPLDVIKAVKQPKFSKEDKYTWQEHIEKRVRKHWYDLNWDARVYAYHAALTKYTKSK